jgi:hypothetical protein
MAVLFYGSLLFGLGLVVHLVMWRIHLPKRQAKMVLLVFLGVLCCGCFVFWKYGVKVSMFGLRPPGDLAQYLQLCIFYVSLTLAYVITYSAIEADSPSLVIIMRISEAGRSGLAREALNREIDNRILIEPRVRDLLVDRMAELHEGKYRLTTKGLLMARLFTFYRNVMRANKGG